MNYPNPFTYTDTNGYQHTVETATGTGNPTHTQRVHNESCEALLAVFPEA